MKRFWVLIILSICTLQCLKAQDTLILKQDLPDPAEIQTENNASSVVLRKPHSPRKATLLALIPGMGQVYNKKYWKLPIVYAGFGVTTYYAVVNGDDYKLYKQAYDYKMGFITDVSDKVKREAEKYTAENLLSLRDYYRSNMELCWILAAAWYVLQIIDANVDAHFFYYDISDELTLQVEPKWDPSFNEYAQGKTLGNVGVSVKFSF